MISTLGSDVPLVMFTSNKVKRDQRRLRSDQKGLKIVFLDQKCLSFGGLGVYPPPFMDKIAKQCLTGSQH